MFYDLHFQSTRKYFEYVVPFLKFYENPFPNVTSYHNPKACKCGTESYFVGYDVNNEFHIVDPAFLENCISANKKLFLSPKFLEKVEMNPNNKHKLLYQTQQLLNKNKKKSIDDIQTHYIQRVVLEFTNDRGKKSNVVAFNGLQANVKTVKGITINWIYTNFYLRENKFY